MLKNNKKHPKKSDFRVKNIQLNGTMRQKIVKKLKSLRLFKFEQKPRGILGTSLFKFFKKKGKIYLCFSNIFNRKIF